MTHPLDAFIDQIVQAAEIAAILMISPGRESRRSIQRTQQMLC